MKKTTVLVALVLMTLLMITGCTNSRSSAASSSGKNETEEPKVKVIKLASITAANDDLYEYRAGLEFQKKVEEYSNGTMKVEYYPASQLGNSTEMVEGVSVGTIDMGMSVGFDIYANLDPICSVVGMPYIFKDYDHMHAFLEGDNDAIKQIKQSLIDKVDVRIMGYCYRPFRSIVTMEKEIRTPEDLDGLTVRSPEAKVNMQWLSAMGASPVTISWSELYTSLSNGAAQGAENSITEFYGANFQDIVGTASETNHMAVTCLLTCNNSWYESLTEEQKEVVNKASQDLTDYTWEGFKEASEQAWKAFEENGVKCIRHEDIDDAAFRERSANVYKEFVDNGDFTQELYDSIHNLQY